MRLTVRLPPVVAALVFALLPAGTRADPGSLVVVDGGLLLSARASVNAGRAELQPLLALRGAYLTPLAPGSGLVLGGDARLSLETLPRVRGTADVGSLSWELALEPRALVGFRLETGALALVPYAFAGALVGGRLADVYAFDTHHLRGHPTFGVTLGGGGLLQLGVVTLSLELGGGLREDGPALTTGILVGGGF